MSRGPHEILIEKLNSRSPLGDVDRQALHSLRCVTRIAPAHSYLIREGDRPTRCGFIVDGFACRQKLTRDGARQIVAIMVPGDFADLQQLFLVEMDHNVQTLTPIEVAEIPILDLQTLALERPAINRALWVDSLIEAAATREMVLNIGRRLGPVRVAHLICEFETRLAAAGLADQGYDLPMSQEQIADATGMTAVHVNRTVRRLEKDGLIRRSGRSNRSLTIADWPALKRFADFSPRYLHLQQTA